MGKIGSELGRNLGGKAGSWIGGKLGSLAGSIAGNLIPFKKGGRIRKTGPIYAHKGEYILPKGVRPTKAQKKRVAKGKR